MPAKDTKSKEPVSLQEVYQALCGAASQDAATLKASSEALQDYMGRPGTYDQLHSIAADKSKFPLDVRQMAIIQFKNGGLPAWKNKRIFSNDNRADIRTRCIRFLHEEDNSIADCNALIVARIARSDFPAQWPSLVSDLINAMHVEIQKFLSNPTGADPANTLFLKRILRVLDQVIKEFGSIKMPGGIRIMATLADVLYSPLISHYDQLSGLLRASLTPETLLDPLLRHACEELVEISHMVFKPCVKIMLWLWHKSGQPEFSSALETLTVFAQSCFQLAQGLFELRIQLILALRHGSSIAPSVATSSSTSPPTIPVPAIKSLHQLTRHLQLYGKMFKRMQQLDARKFTALPQVNELVLYYWGEVVKATSGPPELISDSPDAVYPVRLLVQGMVLFRESVAAWSPKGKPNNAVDVLSEQFVQEAVKILLTRFIPLAPTDLERWMIDPEEWVNEEEKGGDAWEFDLRPCSERVLLTLCIHYHAYVIPLLSKTFEEVISSPSKSLESILRKEAVYCAIGRCSHWLQNKLDFDDWLQRHLIAEAQEPNPDYRIIKRRIAWVIGKWHSSEGKSQYKTQIWEVLRLLMHDRGQSSDPVVRLTAAEALRECIDTVAFEGPTFLPFLRDFVAELLRLVIEADTTESRIRLIKTLNTVIEYGGIHIVPFIDNITSPLPQVWQDAGDDLILKASLIVTVTQIVQAAKEHSASVMHLVISLVRESFDPRVKLQLDEDGLILWQAALRNAVTLANPHTGSPGFIDMFPHAMGLVSDDLDVLGATILIVQSYILIDGIRIITAHGRELFQALAAAIRQAVTTNLKQILLTINLIAQVVPPVHYLETIHSSGLFAALVKAVIDDKSPALMLTEHIYLFARIAIWDPLVLNQLLAASAPSLNMSETQVMEGVLDQWWSKFDNMAEPRHRKLAAMGIASWVSIARPEVLGRLHTEIFNIWLDVFAELKEALAESVGGAQSPLKMFWVNSAEQFPQLPPGVEGTVEEGRRRQVHLQDPVTTEKLTVFVKARLQQAEMNCGGTEVFRANYLDKADPTVLSQLTAALMTGN